MKTSFEERYANLNAEQKRAVDTIDGPVLVVAGPGSGKTELLSLRVGNILQKTHASPHNILCLTFTENGAINMRDRLLSLIGGDAYRVSIFTFHAFCNHIISRFPEYFYQAATFSQATDIIRTEIFEEIFSSLPHKHPLASKHPEEGFVYMRDVIARIKHIKGYGYTWQEYLSVVEGLRNEYDAITEILSLWPSRLTMKLVPEIEALAARLETLQGTTSLYLSKTLKNACTDTYALGKTELLGDWKAKYTVKTDDGITLKDAHNYEKIVAVADIYKRYSETMYERGLYDYDDMIIEVAHTLRTDTILRSTLEEQYQYILIDEFQDTNEAQMSLVRAITSSEIHEGKPNVCVVGDDDQAIYKFQGAEVSHIMHFRDVTYKDVQTIVLTKNYRSTKDVLTAARHIITQGKHRLETRYDDITKDLAAMNTSLPQGGVHVHTFNADVEEYAYIARTIKQQLDDGTHGDDIAVLARGHKELQALLPYLNREQIPYEYIKRANVFDEPHVRILISVCEYVASIIRNEETADHVLPELLSYTCFGVDRLALFDLAVEAKENHISWTQALRTSNHPRIHELGELFAELTVLGKTAPLEHVIETFMEKSGFKAFYFSREAIQSRPTEYVSFLASLKTFIEALREWREGEPLFVSDVEPFVRMHKDNYISLTSESPFMKSEHAVQLMTAHASKGLEFGTVFIVSAHDKLWTKPQKVNKAPLPSPLVPLMQPAGDMEDDFIRLLYVAVTRAKHTLYITSHDQLLRYISQDLATTPSLEIPIEAHENALSILAQPFKEDEWALLKRLVKNYRMPVTHMHNFLSIGDGGPLYFIEQNLLRFPQPMNASGVYGSAVHKALEEMVMYPKYHAGEHASLGHILATFNKTLSRGRLPEHEETKERNRGTATVTSLYTETKDLWHPDDRVEVDMKGEQSMCGDAHLTGKIDFLRVEEDGYHVYDFKTGKSFDSWDDTKTPYDKIKLHTYRQQLIVYKILLESSVHYKDKPVTRLALWFVEETPIKELVLDVQEAEVEHVKKLLQAVYTKITTLSFPDTSNYPETIEGIVQFEHDLIEGKI